MRASISHMLFAVLFAVVASSALPQPPSGLVTTSDKAAAGYTLVGGRLLPGDNGPVAHFMYQTAQGRRITLYVRTEAAENRETAFRFAAEGNVKVFYWIDHKLGYALSSADMSKDELFKIANVVYRQLNP